MNRRVRLNTNSSGPFFPGAALVLGLSILALFVSGQSPPPKQDVSDFEGRMNRLNTQIRDIKARIAAESRKESSILSELVRLDLNRRLILKEIATQNLQMNRTTDELGVLKTETAKQRLELEENQEAVEKTIVTLYKFGRPDFLEFILQAEDLETILRESKNLGRLAEYQNDAISGYLRTLGLLRENEIRLESKQRELAALLEATTLKREELEAETRKNLDLVDRIRRNKSAFERTVSELVESSDQLQGMLKRVINNEWILPGPFVPLNERKGQLSWPIEGRVITWFGFQRHPRFNTIIMNNGIEIVPRKDITLIQSIHPGKVAYADYQGGYGNVIILDHGMGYYSLYGHCAEFLVGTGEMIKDGQPIALVGDTGSLNGECLYFEVRHRSEALNPLQWLKRK